MPGRCDLEASRFDSRFDRFELGIVRTEEDVAHKLAVDHRSATIRFPFVAKDDVFDQILRCEHSINILTLHTDTPG